MSQCIFKRLFEVRFLHDYFLNIENQSFFMNTLTDVEKEERLQELMSIGQLDMREEIKICPTEKTKEHLRNYRLRFIQTPIGFFIGGQVKKNEPGDGSVTYEPFIPIGNNLEFSFHIYQVNPKFKSYSNVPLKKRIEAIYHFDNRNGADKTAPALSLPVQEVDEDIPYEMGELVMDVGQLLKGATEDYDPDSGINLSNILESVEGEGLVNTNDRRLLPKKFFVRIPDSISLTEVTVELLDTVGNVINEKNIDTSGNVALISINLLKDDDGEIVEVPDGTYTLTISDDQGWELSRQVLLSEELYNKNAFAALSIDTGETETGFKILESDGSLVERVNSAGVSTPAPRFELRMLSRRCYWRYKTAEIFDLSNIPNLNGALQQPSGVDNITFTTSPQNLTRIPIKINNTLNLPNPNQNAPLRSENGRYYADIYISAVNKLFIP